MFYKKAVLKNLTVLEALRPETLLIRNSNRGVSCEYCEISRNTYFEEHLQTAASEKAFVNENDVNNNEAQKSRVKKLN